LESHRSLFGKYLENKNWIILHLGNSDQKMTIIFVGRTN
jgi:hypothetical protein